MSRASATVSLIMHVTNIPINTSEENSAELVKQFVGQKLIPQLNCLANIDISLLAWAGENIKFEVQSIDPDTFINEEDSNECD